MIKFKEYNDLYGHREGDVCLQRVTECVGQVVSAENSHFVRYGGDEFVLCLVGLDREQAKAEAEQIRETVESNRIAHTGAKRGYVTVSIGVCFSPADRKSTIGQLVHYADDALYVAKQNGRNRVEFFADPVE